MKSTGETFTREELELIYKDIACEIAMQQGAAKSLNSPSFCIEGTIKRRPLLAKIKRMLQESENHEMLAWS